MAVELESSNMSPRISFSHDFCQSDFIPVEQRQQGQHLIRSNSTGIDFDFCVRKSFDQESSSADELFSDGKILPTEVKQLQQQKQKQNKKKNVNPAQAALPILPKDQESLDLKPNNINNNKITRDEAGDDDDLEENDQNNNNNKQSSKSFWKFKRSSSLNCGSGYGRSLCPLPPLLSRSNSTGSASNDKRAALSKDGSNKSPSSSSIKSSYLKPPLKKNYGSYGNGVHVNPVLNVPSGNLFGLGSIFGKDKNKKK
ncbi:F1O19.11 protein [Citrus sinensis]|uniref:uncharacterized protein LOC102608344 n=1 Tax=Citrus sinensis TaxID=2711 RepID=UPI0003D7391C|nr:uncharacterized protein LOC102608344 [Citrus sinensis]KAH9675732.1 F1O19.11 protein [Citrus sinensis]GAY43888.1 hypothetical protein CUMW_078050 [Citrus unshiu]